ncbi:helix-turn-helix domain-containing protein [Actinoallomurus sp. CA-150999]|uniref:helix-turn-helix domain-containing protein n=1 Tax=Actinoallomurus sp. CA-150999 TaxID=3239887 RepID=UPI003D92EDAC
MQDDDRVGSRVAALRKMRGITGRRLAHNAHISYSLLTKVEAGHVAASPAFIAAVARALGVEITRITGQPYDDPQSRADQLQATIHPLRRALLTYDLPADLDALPRPVEDLRREVAHVSLLGRRARYLELGKTLPALLDELSAAIAEADDRSRPGLYALLAEAYGGVSALGQLLGHLDLRVLTLDRIEWAARQSQDHLRVARTNWSRGASLLGVGAYDQGLALMERTRRDLGDDAGRMDEATLSVYGSLHLRSAILAARANRRRTADDHLAEARGIATLVRPDANHYGMEFGPANVGIHEVSAAIEGSEGTLAIERAERAERTGLTTLLPPVRLGHYRIELARAWLYHGDRRRALSTLQSARRIAPQQVRYHPLVRETVHAIAHSEPRPTDDLRSLASWLAIDR